MTRHLFKKLTTLGVVLTLATSPLALAAMTASEADPTIIEVFTGDTIHVARLPDNIYLRDVNDPDDIIWSRIPAYRIGLNAAPPVHASTQLRFDPTDAGQIYFQLARTTERFYVRLRWNDSTQDLTDTVDTFSDSAAIQFALNGDDTSFMMGTGPDKPVNIWYWRASGNEVQNLAAGGYGSTTHLPDQTVTGKAIYHTDQNDQNNQWHLVMSRKLDSPGEYQAALQNGTVPVSFALWQGDKGQRDGNKRVNMGWILVDVQPKSDDAQKVVQKSGQPERNTSADAG